MLQQAEDKSEKMNQRVRDQLVTDETRMVYALLILTGVLFITGFVNILVSNYMFGALLWIPVIPLYVVFKGYNETYNKKYL